jgi:hypothetical protein
VKHASRKDKRGRGRKERNGVKKNRLGAVSKICYYVSYPGDVDADNYIEDCRAPMPVLMGLGLIMESVDRACIRDFGP